MIEDETPDREADAGPAKQWAPTDFRRELLESLTLLETMFDDPGLDRLRASDSQHPAVIQYDRLQALTSVGSLAPETESDVVMEVARMVLDRHTWASAGHPTDYWEVLVGDRGKARNVRGMLADGDQYSDTLLELYYCGHLRQRGVEAALVGQEGMPDIRAGASDNAPLVEAKRVRPGTDPIKARRALKKANRQIKRASPDRAGAVVIQVSRNHVAATFDDKPPPDVQACKDEIQVALASGLLTHTAVVVLIWDDFMVLGTPPARSLYAIRRKSLLIKHSAPITPLDLADDVLLAEWTFTMWVNYSGVSESDVVDRGHRDVARMPTLITDQFRDQSHSPGGVRPSHARGVLESPDGMDELVFEDLRVLLFSKEISVTASPHVLLVVCTQRADGPLELNLAFRLYDESDIDTLAADPRAALMTLIARFGLPIDIGGHVALLHERAILKSGEAVRLPEVGSFMVSLLLRPLPGGSTEVPWAFAIDSAAYVASLRAD